MIVQGVKKDAHNYTVYTHILWPLPLKHNLAMDAKWICESMLEFTAEYEKFAFIKFDGNKIVKVVMDSIKTYLGIFFLTN